MRFEIGLVIIDKGTDPLMDKESCLVNSLVYMEF